MINECAQICTPYTLACLICKAIGYLKIGIMLIISLAVVVFIWNVYKYFFKAGADAEHRKEAGMYVMWSVIGFFVILSFWGLVAIVSNTLNLPNAQPGWWSFGGSGGQSIFNGTTGSRGSSIFNGTTGSSGGKGIYNGTTGGAAANRNGTLQIPPPSGNSDTSNYQPQQQFNGLKPADPRVDNSI